MAMWTLREEPDMSGEVTEGGDSSEGLSNQDPMGGEDDSSNNP